jgi:O-antigen/teichoic acid export membrane protein
VILTFGSKLVVMVLTVAMTVVVARALGPAGRGLVSVALALSLILVQVGTVGLVSANPYFVTKDRAALAGLFTNSLWLTAALSALLCLAGVVIKWLAPGVVPGLDWGEVLITLAMVPTVLGSAFLQSLLLGLGRTVPYNAVEVVHNIVVLSALAVGLLALDGGVAAALLVMAVGWALTLVAYVVILRIDLERPRWMPDVELARTVFRYGMRVYVSTLLAFVVIRVDMFFVNAYLGASQAGLYSVAAALAEGVYLLPVVVGLNLFPRVAEGGDSEASASVFRTMFLLYGAMVLISIPLVRPFIDVLYGQRFGDAAQLYYWLAPGVFALGMLSILGQHFAGRGFPLEASLVWVVGLALNIAINVVFLKSGGTYVASLSSSIAYGAVLLLYMRLFARELGGYRRMMPRPREAFDFLRLLVSRLTPHPGTGR